MAHEPQPGLDILSTPDGEFTVDPSAEQGVAMRRWIGILFECCGVYARVYRRPEERKYDGRCPQCGRRVIVRVGPDGVSGRLFRARLS